MKNNNFLIFIPLLLLGANSNKNVSSDSMDSAKKNTLDVSINSFINNIANTLTVEDISNSVETLEKIGPYLPEPYINKVDSFVFNFEKINKINELLSFLSKEKPKESNVSSQGASSKERFNKILLTLKDDIPEDKIKNVRPIIDIVANFDRYKSMIQMISAMNSPSEKSEDKMDSMIDMVMPLLSQNGESSDKMKDMLNIFKNIASSSPSEEADSQEQDYESQ